MFTPVHEILHCALADERVIYLKVSRENTLFGLDCSKSEGCPPSWLFSRVGKNIKNYPSSNLFLGLIHAYALTVLISSLSEEFLIFSFMYL